MPAVFRYRDTHIDTKLSSFSTTMSFAMKVRPFTAEIPNFFNLGQILLNLQTNQGDYSIIYEHDGDLVRFDILVVHASETSVIWQYTVPAPGAVVMPISCDVTITGTTRAASDVNFYYGGQLLASSGTVNMGTQTPPASASASWTIGGTLESGPETLSGLRGEVGDVSIFNRILTATEHATINRVRNPENISGCVLSAPLRNSLSDYGSNARMTWEAGDTNTNAGLVTRDFSRAYSPSTSNLRRDRQLSAAAPSGDGNSVRISNYIGNMLKNRVGTYI